MKNSCSETPNERETLFSYWNDLPNVILFELPSKIMYSHKARGAILKLLREGTKEGDRIRHALKVEEIRQQLQERYSIKMSQTNLYFHLGVLEEYGVIKVVKKITEGRHNVAYYGRTSKAILTRDPEESLEKYSAKFIEAGRWTKAKYPDFDAGQIMGLAEEYLQIKQRRDRELSKWVNENEELLRLHDIDLGQVFEFLKTLDSVNPEYVDFLNKIGKTLKIEI